MNELTLSSFVDAVIATGLGLFIGIEREHSDKPAKEVNADEKEAARPAEAPGAQLGVRTFALLALLGWVCGVLEGSVRGVTLVALVMAGALVVLQYVSTWRSGGGITTEVAAVVTFALGLLVRQSRLLAVALALVVTLLLIAKPWVRRAVAAIERRELTATLQLAIMLAIVLPLLPEKAPDPWGVLGPRKIGFFVVLIGGISFVGYVLSRLVGASAAAGLSGLVGGLASSTAVTAAMAARARTGDAMVAPAQLGTFLANAVMFARVIVVSALLNRAVALRLAAPMVVMGLVMLAAAFWRWRGIRSEAQPKADAVTLENPFALIPALKWGLLLAAILVATALAREHFGTRGLYIAAAVSGFADVDAINVAVSREAGRGPVGLDAAVMAVTTAAVTNTITKGGIALISGGARFGRAVALVFAIAIALGLTIAVLV